MSTYPQVSWKNESEAPKKVWAATKSRPVMFQTHVAFRSAKAQNTPSPHLVHARTGSYNRVSTHTPRHAVWRGERGKRGEAEGRGIKEGEGGGVCEWAGLAFSHSTARALPVHSRFGCRGWRSRRRLQMFGFCASSLLLCESVCAYVYLCSPVSLTSCTHTHIYILTCERVLVCWCQQCGVKDGAERTWPSALITSRLNNHVSPRTCQVLWCIITSWIL